jgi:hypothetical protein
MAILSLVLLAVTVALCAKSYLVEDSVGRGSPYQIDQVVSRRGRLFYRRTIFVAPAYRTNPQVELAYPPQWSHHALYLSNTDLAGRDLLGFSYGVLPVPGVGVTTGGSDWYFSVPYWFIVLLSASACVWAWRRKQASRDGNLCPTCGYDLRASPGRCPECGTRPK